jgi:hypothetical protein
MSGEERVEELAVIDLEELVEAQRIAAENGVEVEEFEVAGIEPVTTVTLLLVGSSLAVATVLHILDKRKGGQVVDLRVGAPKMFYRSRDLIYGLVTIIAADGKVTVEVKEPREMYGQVIDALKGILTELGRAGVAEIAKSVNTAVGDAAKVQVVATAP